MEALVSSAKWPLERSRDAGRPARAPGVLYGQVWEDADVLLEALDVQPGHVCLSIASAGDNTLALLARGPERVIAVDRSEAQLYCLELRVAAFRTLEYEDMLRLYGSRPSSSRAALYARCRPALSRQAREFWDRRPAVIAAGIGGAGQFERYFALLRTWLLPLVHGRATVAALVTSKTARERESFYDEVWDTWQWRLLFRLFFSRAVMRRLGRRPECFAHAAGAVAAPILARTRYALTSLDPADNPYLHWILTGTHGDALPYALRREHFDQVRSNLDRLEWHCAPLDRFLEDSQTPFDRANLSDVFEYLAPSEYEATLGALARTCRPGARLAYWNLLARRSRPASLAARLRPLDELAARLHARDRAFFYQRLVIEEVTS